MTKGKRQADVKALLATNANFLRPLVQAVLQELMAAEMTEALGGSQGRADAGSHRLSVG